MREQKDEVFEEAYQKIVEKTNTQRRNEIGPKDILKGLKRMGLKGASMSGNNIFIGGIESGIDLSIAPNGKWYVES